MYKIVLKDCEVFLPIGIYESEKERKQRVVVQLECLAHSQFKFDSIDDCINYSKIAHFIKKFENEPHIELIEQLQLKIIKFCFDLDENIYHVDLTVFKTEIISFVECGINMKFSREDFQKIKV